MRALDVEALAIDARRSGHPAEPGNVRVLAAGTSWAAILGVAFKDQFNIWIALAMCVGPLIAAYVATFPMLRKAG